MKSYGNTKHGGKGTPLYALWCSIKRRCKHSARYSDRGISVCAEWADSFEIFRDYVLEHLGPHPGRGMTFDRINNDGNYEPNNVRWATYKEQNHNRREIPVEKRREISRIANAAPRRSDAKNGFAIVHARMTPEERSEKARRASQIRWAKEREI